MKLSYYQHVSFYYTNFDVESDSKKNYIIILTVCQQSSKTVLCEAQKLEQQQKKEYCVGVRNSILDGK